MYIFILPVSGGRFPSQLGILKVCFEAQLFPDLVLASSGGNAAAYIAAAGNWSSCGIDKVIKTLKPNMLAKKWHSMPFMASMLSFFKGTVYSKGEGADQFFDYHFSPAKITSVEIWTGMYNQAAHRTVLFCNRSEEASILATCSHHQYLSPRIYGGGNVQKAAASAVATASIPLVIPSGNMDGAVYVDGGVSAASPLIFLMADITEITTDKHEKLHFVYVNSLDTDTLPAKQYDTIIENGVAILDEFVIAQYVNDRNIALAMIRTCGRKLAWKQFPLTVANLGKVKRFTEQADVTASLLELYPLSVQTINIDWFVASEIETAIANGYIHSECRFWWCGEGSLEV